jgi:hypothetical protein
MADEVGLDLQQPGRNCSRETIQCLRKSGRSQAAKNLGWVSGASTPMGCNSFRVNESPTGKNLRQAGAGQLPRSPFLDNFLFADHPPRTRAPFGFFLGTPLVWQSIHLTKCMLCGLLVDLKVVSIVSTSSPQLDNCG